MLKLNELNNWQDGINQVLCCDCLDLMKMMPDKCVDLVLTDPPYALNFGYDKYDDTRENLKLLIGNSIKDILRIGKIVAIMPGITQVYLYPEADWIIACSWNTTGSFGKMGFSQWFPVLIYGKDIKGFGNVNGIIKSDLISVSGGGGVGFMRNGDKDHPCPKPYNLIKKLIQRLSFDSNLIFDPFMGSWTTAKACQELHRNFIGAELSEKYCQIGEQRLAQKPLF